MDEALKRVRLGKHILDLIFSIGFLIIAFLVAWSFISPRALPWWVDGGEWLKYAKGLFGEIWPLWGESPLNYPPLFPTILAGILSLTGDPSFSIKFLAALVFAFRPSAAYIFSIWVFRSRFAAFIAAATMLILPIHVEILGWGGYPNLLCLSLLMIAMGSLISWLRGDDMKAFLILIVTSMMVAIGHLLGVLVYSFALLLLLISLLALKRGKAALKIFLTMSITLGTYFIYGLAFLWPPRYILNNEAAYYHLSVILPSGLLTWIFKSSVFLLLLYELMAVAILSALIIRRYLLEVGVLVAWLISPLLLSNLHELGIALDYHRVFFFFTDPFVLLASSVPLFFFSRLSIDDASEVKRLKNWILKNIGSKWMDYLKRLIQILLLLGIVVASISSIYYGYRTFISIDGWYNYRDKYGDWEKLDVLKWIKYNTPRDSIFVAEEEIGRWIEGYSSRRVLMYAHPMYLFIRGEQERAYAARAILLSELYLTNGVAALYEPHDPRENISTRIALKTLGALEEIFFLESNSSYLKGYFNGKSFKIHLADAMKVKTFEYDDQARVRYIFDAFVIEKILSIEPGAASVSLIFKIDVLKPGIRIKNLVIELKEWSTRKFWEVKVKPNGKLLLATDVGPIIVETNADIAFPFVFNSGQEAAIKISSLKGSEGGGKVKLIHSRDLMKKYGARYIVIPRIQETTFERHITLKPATKPEYMHLLNDPTYRIAYQNDRVIILELVES